MAFFFKDKSKKVQENPQPKLSKEIGSSGVQFFSGMIHSEEYITDLQGTKGIEVYDRMRRSDGQVKGVSLAITLPILQTKWFIDPASESPQDIEIAEAIENNLFNGMSITWNSFLRQALTNLLFGFSIFEKVFEFKDGLIQYRKLAPRLQKTIYRWYQDDHGGFNGVQQFTQTPDGSFEYLDIPRDKCLLFTNDQEGSNFEGISILRAAYKHWYIKDQLYTIDALGHDRFSSGIPYAKEAPNANPQDKARVAEIMRELYSREKSYLVVPNEWEVGVFEKTSGNEAIIKSIQHHNEEMAKAVLAQFINLGTTETGSRALGESFEELFLMSLNAVAENIEENMNRYCIKPLVDYNWQVDEYPKLRHQRIMLDVYKYLKAMGEATRVGLLSKGLDTENSTRDILGLAEKTEEEFEKEKAEKIKQQQDMFKKNGVPDVKDKDDEDKEAHEHSGIQLREYKRRRQLTECEKTFCDFDKVEYILDEGIDRIESVVEKVRKAQAKQVAKEVVQKNPEDIKVPFIGKLASRIYDEMIRMYNKGRLHVKEELESQERLVKQQKVFADKKDLQDFQDEEEAKEWLKSKSKADAVRLGNNLESAALFALYTIETEGKTKSQIEHEVYGATATTGVRETNNIASSDVNAAYGLGREAEAAENEERIEYAVYSAILDAQVCQVCLPKDGVKHALDDPIFKAPNPQACLGGSRCRCINIYKLDGMEGEFVTKTKTDYHKDINNTTVEKEREKFKI